MTTPNQPGPAAIGPTPAPKPVAVKRGHPAGLYLLFVTEMWERFSFYGMKAMLMLYMTSELTSRGLGWSEEKAGSMYGWYTGLVYLTPIAGGYAADRWLGTHRSMVVGGLIISLGHFTLALENAWSFYTGLLFIIIGTGFFKPCVTTMVGQLYGKVDPRRDAAFTIFYMGINLGAFLGPLICGFLRARYGWSYGFGAAGVGMVLGLIVYMMIRNRVLAGIGDAPHIARRRASVRAGGAARDAECADCRYDLAGLPEGDPCPECGSVQTVPKSAPDRKRPLTREEKHRVAAIFILSFFVIFFWTGFELAGTSMTLFGEDRTDRSLPRFLHWAGTDGLFPTEWFQSVNPLFILLLAFPFATMWVRLARLGRQPSTPTKFGLGLVLVGLGFLIMVGGASASEAGDTITRVTPWFLIGAYFVHTLGELCVSPVGLSAVSRLAPAKFLAMLMGVWFLANFAANKLSGTMGGMVDRIGERTVQVGGITLTGQPLFYSIFVVAPVAAGIVMLAISPLVKKLMHGRA